MPRATPAIPGVDDGNYHILGRKTFLTFLLGRIHAAVILFLLAVGISVVESDPAIMASVGSKFAPLLFAATWILWALFILVAGLTYLIAWILYVNYKFVLGPDALKILRGILNKEEIAIPYRQMQDVDVERDLYFRMMGLSRLVILTAGRDDDKSDGDNEAEGILPAMNKELADWLQKELLRRTDIQRVVEINQVGPTSQTGG